MRKIKEWNQDWKFSKSAETEGEKVAVPHTWNALDGQDGGDDYYRGQGYYTKEFPRPQTEEGEQVYLECAGVANSALVSLNGKELCTHDGGFSTFRVNLTPELKETNRLTVIADNSVNDRVYPQKADFTFYGGVYRDVRLAVVPRVHFSMDYFGGNGLKISPVVKDGQAEVTVETWLSGPAASPWQENAEVRITLEGDHAPESRVMPVKREAGQEADKTASVPGSSTSGYAKAVLKILCPHLWNGRKDPYLYTAKAELLLNGELQDEVRLRFGCRSFSVDPEQGFFLNGEAYPLRGVSRHQDREGVGNALTREMHREDMELIAELGANSIRLAHYQHDQYFYDLCDEYGMVVWAEIPYITRHMENGRENTLQQMQELIVQNHHHASVCFWGISNEISAGGLDQAVLENNHALERLVKKLDDTRLTTMACAFMLEENSPMLSVTDTVAYNHYFGWYMGSVEENDRWFDRFHREHPALPVGLSEYGAEAVMQWQTDKPERGDYTEQYQALYHEHMLRMIEERPYLWCTYVWNMFDFAADGRDEGGVKGRNNKGLVTFDRKIKKESFYLYKAYWSEEPFVYITGRRFVNRAETETEVKVYSNQKEVSLYQNGKLVGSVERSGHIFRFRITLEKDNELTAKAGEAADSIVIHQTDAPDPSYTMPVMEEITNWLDGVDIQLKEGYFTLDDRVEELVNVPEGEAVFLEFLAAYDSRKQGAAASVKMTMEQRMATMRSMKLSEFARRTNTPAEEVTEFLRKLQTVKKPDGDM